ncbi:MAG TPA: hypothetical protein VFP49_04630 [Nitrososphaeraceae archaeon]|nr:hypothetical protein [Nitrososphaeraceae archaeon]
MINNSNNRWDEIDEFKGGKIYESREGSLRAIAHVIKEYLQVKEIRSNPKTVDNVMAPITNMVLNDKEFRKFALENYKVFISYDKKDADFHIKRITDEISAALIKEEEKENIDNLDNKEFENKIKELESSLNKKDNNNDKKYVSLIIILIQNLLL